MRIRSKFTIPLSQIDVILHSFVFDATNITERLFWIVWNVQLLTFPLLMCNLCLHLFHCSIQKFCKVSLKPVFPLLMILVLLEFSTKADGMKLRAWLKHTLAIKLSLRLLDLLAEQSMGTEADQVELTHIIS
jgi:hypothetical protein